LTAAAVPGSAEAAIVQYAAPAGLEPAGRLPSGAFDAILPSGRFVTPQGESVATGAAPGGFALSPDGRFAIVAAGGSPDQPASLTVIDTGAMTITGSFPDGATTPAGGVVAVRDPRQPVRSLVFAARAGTVTVDDLDAAGRLEPDAKPQVAIGSGATFDALGGPPPSLVAAADGRHIYVLGAAGVAAIDTATRAVVGTSAAGFFPAGAAPVADRLLVTNEGLTAAGPLADMPLTPSFAAPPAAPLRASALTLISLGANGDLAAGGAAPSALALDEPADGEAIVGGAHPTAVAATPDGAYAFITMTNVDRIATVALGDGAPHVAGGTELRLFDRGPYGTQPAALALAADGTRLYVALAGLNAVAVLDARDPLHVHRLGLIPTGWVPCALELGDGDHMLYVLNRAGATDGRTVVGSTLEKIDLGAVTLGESTRKTLKNTREVRTDPPHYPAALQRVVVIETGSTTFDALLGDLDNGAADPTDLRYGESVTPNLHALARRYALAANVFADDDRPCLTHQWISAGIATVFAQRSQPACDRAAERPEDYPRAGYLFNDLARHGASFRDYGDLARLAGSDDGAAPDPRSDDPEFAGIDDRAAPTRGLGSRYGADIPGPAVLAEHIDPNYPGWNVRIRDERRAREFIHDFGALVRARGEPRYTHIWLPGQGDARGPDVPPPGEQIADGDRALGTIVEFLTHLPAWKSSAIFIVADGVAGQPDHVGSMRTYALVVSPFAKRRYVGMQHLSTVSVLKTAEAILGVPPLALGDLLATDLSDFFTSQARSQPFAALPVPRQFAAAPGALPRVHPDRTEAAHAATGTGRPTPNALGKQLARTVTTNGIRGPKTP
jgi:DNA-binding beta-propeller fold protein YncE